ncbi:hypothetical protein SAMN05720606_10874 [Paenibacillus polysaccharolyticus]|uniref:Uncharacterized protein n=1 Tax=Paenibacillus polysaccharolyticus TaxID=582692 RepID=A0A1G5I924_9BACL|nr:hypothetical protein [Paenibacillus polysaccharolyticus]SCY71758.1 hypothetical protein SAMN05720606_10874 [Paenibacillus polysaccharolyticus]
MKMILNERQHAEEALEYGKMDKKPTKTLVCIAKYEFEQGYTPTEVQQMLDGFMSRNYADYNAVQWDAYLTRVVNQTANWIKKRKEELKSTMIEIENIPVTVTELQKIKELRSIRLEKLAFVMLVYSKINNLIHETKAYWINNDLKEIYSDCEMAVSKKDQGLLIYKLIQEGYLKESKRVDSTNVQVLFASEEDTIAFYVKRFDDFVLEYLRWKGANIKNCIVCGRNIHAKSNRMKYCKKCKKDKRN